MNKKKINNIVKFLVFFGIGIFFVYWFFLKLDVTERQAIWQSITSARWQYVVAILLVSLLAHVVRAMRWQLLFKPIDYNPSWNNTFGAVMVAYLANLAVPRLGEILRCAMLKSSDNIPIEKSIGTVVTERIIDMLLFIIVVVVGLIFMFNDVKDFFYDQLTEKFSAVPSLLTITCIMIAVLIVLYVLVKKNHDKLMRIKVIRKLGELIKGCVDGIKSIFHLGKKSTVKFIIYSLVIYFLYIAGGWVMLKAFGET